MHGIFPSWYLSIETSTSIHDVCSDIWQIIFQYFDTTELFTTLAHLTVTADQVLFNENEHFYLRGLVINEHLEDLPMEIILNRAISLTLYDSCCLDIIEQCSKLRSLRLFGSIEWITSLIWKVISQSIKLEQLIIVISGITSLPELLAPILSIFSLRRLEICADDFKDSCRICDSNITSNNIEQFILRSSSTPNCADLLFFSFHLMKIQLLNISLITKNKSTIPSFNFRNLRTLVLGLLEVSFDWIVQVVATIPCLVKLKLNGLVNEEGFVVNERWIDLFESAHILARIFVDLSLEQGDQFYHCEKVQKRLRVFNLQLQCDDDNDQDCYQYYGRAYRWWSLKGIIIRPPGYL